MQPPENSWLARRNRISLSHRNRCVSPSYSRGANRNGEGRWYSRRRNVSLGIRNERRARISGGVGGLQIASRFPATTNGGYRYGKGGGEKSERCGSVVGCVLAEAVRPLPPTPLPLPLPPCFWLSRQYNSKMVAGLRVPLSFLSPVSARPPGYYCTPGATPWTLR